jgi:hypothetical protein
LVIEKDKAVGTYHLISMAQTQNYFDSIDNYVSSDETIIKAMEKKNQDGYIIANQLIMFKDLRTGAINIPITNLGYQITQRVKKNDEGVWVLTVTAVGKAVSVTKVTVSVFDGKTTLKLSSSAGATDPAKGITNSQGLNPS